MVRQPKTTDKRYAVTVQSPHRNFDISGLVDAQTPRQAVEFYCRRQGVNISSISKYGSYAQMQYAYSQTAATAIMFTVAVQGSNRQNCYLVFTNTSGL